jgi:general secretion pathway protein H
MSGRQSGFTLIELLVVLVLLAAVAGIASARIAGGRAADVLQATAYEIASRCRAARTAAIRHGSQHVVEIDLANRTVRADGGAKEVGIPASIAIRSETSASERRSPSVAGIRFLPDGSSTGGTVTLEAGHRAYVVRVNWFTGRVVVERKS